MAEPMNICWLDLETTGTDEHAGSIVEVGAVLTAPDLTVLEEIEQVVAPDPDHWEAMPPRVREMHDRSGLTPLVEEMLDDPLFAFTVEEADRILRTVLDRHEVGGRVILGGSGVGHFDSRWLRLHMPRSAKRLTYWPYDVGAVRRFLGTVDEALVRPAPEGGKAHRGLADARDHLEEWKQYWWLINGAGTPLRLAAGRYRQDEA